MSRTGLCLAVLAGLLLAAAGRAADQPSALVTAQGMVEKVDKDSLTIRPRGPDGKFEKSVALKLTGTSKITSLSLQKRGSQTVPVQRDTDAKGLQPNEPVAVIYTEGPDGLVLLSAVVELTGGK
jgi:hypothetical protein